MAFTLMEVVVGMFVVGIVIVALYTALASGVRMVQLSRENLRATEILTEKMDALRLYSWDQIMDSTEIPRNFQDYFEPQKSKRGQARGDLLRNDQLFARLDGCQLCERSYQHHGLTDLDLSHRVGAEPAIHHLNRSEWITKIHLLNRRGVLDVVREEHWLRSWSASPSRFYCFWCWSHLPFSTVEA